MEKQTIGGFLATLRKANGYTQREVAEKLGVSDKTLSSWETDKTCPDLTLVPVLADLYGVTSDEILRAERKKTDLSPKESEKKNSGATEKSLRAILRKQAEKFRQLNYILRGVAVVLWLFLAFAIFFYTSSSAYAYVVTAIVFTVLFVGGLVTWTFLLRVYTENALSFADGEDARFREIFWDYARQTLRERCKTSLFLLVPFFLFLLFCPIVCFFMISDTALLLSLGCVAAVADGLLLALWLGMYRKRRLSLGKYITTEKDRTAFVYNGKLLKKCAAWGSVGWGIVTLVVLLFASTLPPVFTLSKKLYSTSDKAEFAKYIQTIDFKAGDAPVELGAIPPGEYYFDVAAGVEEILSRNGKKHTVALKDGFFLKGTGLRGDMGDRIFYNLALYWKPVSAGLELQEIYLRRIVYLPEANAYFLRYPYAYDYSYVLDEKKGVYSLRLEKDASFSVYRACTLLLAFPAPMTLAVFALKKRPDSL